MRDIDSSDQRAYSFAKSSWNVGIGVALLAVTIWLLVHGQSLG
jgi:hypothetical protein